MLSKIWKSAVKALVGLLFMTPFSSEFALAKPSTPSSTPNFFDFSATDIRGKKVHFSQYRGKVVLVVNTASECGFTPQLKDLEELYKKYSAKGFTVLAFPSNDFKQEKGNAEEVRTFAQKEYGISFPIYDKSSVSGDNKLPVFKFLIEQKPGMLFKEVQWNFEKFLIGRDGKVLERWSSVTSPTSKSIVQKIETALNAPM
jgi:glutathione peroxidase